MKSLYLSAAIAALSLAPATANAQIFPSYFDGGTLAGGLIGAGIGGAIGSNLAGGGVQDEGTAIGALAGGLIGANIANRGGRYGGGSRYGSSSYGYDGYNYASGYYGGYAPVAPTYFSPSGQYVTNTHALPRYQASAYVQPTIISQPHTVYTSSSHSGLTYAAPNVRLAGPPLVSHTYNRGITYTESMPIARATREVVQGDCPAGTRYNSADGTCLQSGSSWSSSYGTVTDSEWHGSSSSSTTYTGRTYGSTHVETGHTSPTHVYRGGSNHHYSTPAPAATYCYKGSSKRYDRHGRLIGKSCG